MASQHTTRLNIPYPASSDQANISSDMGGIALALDNAVIYHQTSSGATPPTAANGDVWWCSDATSTGNGYYGLNYYDGTAWQNIGPDVVSATSTPTPYPGLVWVNPSTGVIQVYNSGAWVTVLAYKVPSGATDGQFLQYSASASGLVWSTISTIPSGATGGQLLYFNGSSNAWRNAPAIVTGSVNVAGVAISTTTTTLIPSSAMSGALTGFTQYLLTVNFDTSNVYGGTAGTNPGAAGAVFVQFSAVPNTGSTLSQRAFAGSFPANVAVGGSATVAIVTAIPSSTYSFSVSAITSSGGMTVKNGQLIVTGIK